MIVPVSFILPGNPVDDGAMVAVLMRALAHPVLAGCRIARETGAIVVTPANRTPETLARLIDALVAVNIEWRARHRGTPCCTEVCRYAAELGENWKPTPVLLADKKGDCEDLSADKTAFDRVELGQRTNSLVTFPRGPNKLAHVKNRLQNGKKRDVSRELGMP